MSARKPIIALLVFVLALGLYLIDSHLKEIKRLQKEQEENLINFKRDDITGLRIINKNGEFLLAKKDNAWFVEQPIAVRADQDVLYTLISNVGGAKKRNIFNADDVTQYGLDKPRMKITITAAGKSETLLVGEVSAYVGQVFAMVQGEKKVFTVSDHVANNLDKTLTDLRDKTVARCAPDAVSSFVLTNSNGTIECVRKGEEWEIKKPREYRSDRLAVENLLREIDGSRAVDFVDTATLSTPLRAFGLNTPRVRLVVNRTSPDAVTNTTETTLLVGAPNDATGYFARRAGEPLIFSIPTDLYATLDKKAADLRDKNFFHTTMSDVARIEIEAGESSVTLAKNDTGQWQFEKDPSVRVDQSEVNLTLSTVLARKASQWITDKPRDLAFYGLEPPKIRFVVQKKNGGGSEGVLIGKKPEDKDIVYVQRIGEDTIWGMDWTQTRDFFKSRDDFVDKTLLSVEPDDITRLDVTAEGKQFSLVREAEQWFVKKTPEAKPRPISNVTVESLLAALTSIKYDKEIELSTNQREQIELDNAAYQFHPYDRNDKPLGELSFTRVIRNFAYAETGAEKIYSIKAGNFEALTTALNTLQNEIQEAEF
jgi:hypothetical protein